MKKVTLLLATLLLASCTPGMIGQLEKIIKNQETHILIIGDSQSLGGIKETGTKIPDSTLFDWKQDQFITGDYGTGFYPLMAVENSGKTYILNEAIGGSSYVKSWGSTGPSYENMLLNAQNYIAANGDFDFIFLAVGGIDALRKHPVDQVKKEMIWTVNKLQEDLPGTKILLSKAPGGDNYSEQMTAVRVIEDSIIKANPMIFEAYDIGQLVDRYGAGEITTDGRHLKQNYSDTVGMHNGRLINELKYIK